MPARHLVLGVRGEDAAEELLRSRGYRVLERNVCLGRLELDLVCEAPDKGKTLVFVEVKARGGGSLGGPADGLTRQKCERLLRAARQYLSEKNLWERPCRFDLVAVWEEAGALRAEHVEDAIRAEDVLAAPKGRTGGWQPW